VDQFLKYIKNIDPLCRKYINKIDAKDIYSYLIIVF